MEPAQRVPRWETEIPLLVLVILTSIVMWIMLVVSIVGIFYAVLFAAFFLLAHLALIAHLRGSSIKLGPDQLPHLHVRLTAMAEKLGMKRVPEAYLMQAGGALNAFATKLFRANFVVLYSDLVEACGEDDASLDFVIGHELGHIRAGHVRFQWLLIGRFFPFIGGAYSRAREYTADRYGFAVTSDPRAATRGLVLLAAGPRHAKEVNVEAMLRQRHDMNSVAMKIGSWMSTHPPISDRIAELDRTLNAEKVTAAATSLAAPALIAVAFLAPIYRQLEADPPADQRSHRGARPHAERGESHGCGDVARRRRTDRSRLSRSDRRRRMVFSEARREHEQGRRASTAKHVRTGVDIVEAATANRRERRPGGRCASSPRSARLAERSRGLQEEDGHVPGRCECALCDVATSAPGRARAARSIRQDALRLRGRR